MQLEFSWFTLLAALEVSLSWGEYGDVKLIAQPFPIFSLREK